MSPLSHSLFQYLRSQPDGQNIPMEALTQELRASKTAIRTAFTELEAEGILTLIQED